MGRQSRENSGNGEPSAPAGVISDNQQSSEMAMLLLVAYNGFQIRSETHLNRASAISARIMGAMNIGLNFIFDNRDELARMEMLEPLASVFRQLADESHSLAEVTADRAESRRQFYEELDTVVRAMIDD